jgi:phospholipase C
MPPNVRRMLAQQPPRNNSLSQGTPQEFVNGLPIDGFRVPCIVISPWTAGG